MVVNNEELKLNLCLRCFRRIRTCLCEHVKPFHTQSRFTLLIHPMEFKKERTGTGRISHLVLENSALIDGVNFDEDKRWESEVNDPHFTPVILYPGPGAVNLSEIQTKEELPGMGSKPLKIIVIDGTWPCAKKMMKLTTSLHHLPRVSFTNTRKSDFVIKHQPDELCLSTIESIHQVLIELKRLGAEVPETPVNNLTDIFGKMVERQVQIASDPSLQGYRRKSYSAPTDRKKSKKWEKRSLFYLGE
jgi:DTW domain-containing protein YfiP